VFLGKGSYANSGTRVSKKTKPEVIYLSTCPNRNGTKHLTAIATSFYPVSLNIVLQKAPV
jgi:hypothetical protein